MEDADSRAWPGKPGAGLIPTIRREGPTEREWAMSNYERGVRDATEYQQRERRIEKMQNEQLQRDAKSKSYHEGFADGFTEGRSCTVERIVVAAVIALILLTLLTIAHL